MDNIRSTDANFYQDLPPAVTVMASEIPRGQRIAPHSHKRAQLLYAIKGIMRVHTTSYAWVVPPNRAVWIAPNVEHSLESLDDLSIRTLYVLPERDPFGTEQAKVLTITPLIRELVLRMLESPPVYEKQDTAHYCAELILRELPHLAHLPLQLSLPQDKRLQRVCTLLIAKPNHAGGLEFFADIAAVSSRTLERMFTEELSMTFGKWRQQVRLCEAVARLSRGESVASVASRLGYNSPSAFTAMFKRHFGISPTAIVATLK